MAYVERSDEEMIAALERWIERCPSPDKPALMVRDKTCSIREFVELVKSGKDPVFSVNGVRDIAKERDFDPVQAIDEFPVDFDFGGSDEDQCDGCGHRDQCQGQ